MPTMLACANVALMVGLPSMGTAAVVGLGSALDGAAAMDVGVFVVALRWAMVSRAALAASGWTASMARGGVLDVAEGGGLVARGLASGRLLVTGFLSGGVAVRGGVLASTAGPLGGDEMDLCDVSADTSRVSFTSPALSVDSVKVS